MPPKGDPLSKEQTGYYQNDGYLKEKEPAKQVADLNAKPVIQEIETPIVSNDNSKKVDILEND